MCSRHLQHQTARPNVGDRASIRKIGRSARLLRSTVRAKNPIKQKLFPRPSIRACHSLWLARKLGHPNLEMHSIRAPEVPCKFSELVLQYSISKIKLNNVRDTITTSNCQPLPAPGWSGTAIQYYQIGIQSPLSGFQIQSSSLWIPDHFRRQPSGLSTMRHRFPRPHGLSIEWSSQPVGPLRARCAELLSSDLHGNTVLSCDTA